MKAVLVAAGVVLLVASTASAQWGDYAAPVVVGPVPTVTYYAPPATYYAPAPTATYYAPAPVYTPYAPVVLPRRYYAPVPAVVCRPGLRRAEGVCAG